MTNNELLDKFLELEKNKKALIDEQKELVWKQGVPAIINKMKNLDKDTVYLRAAEEGECLFSTEELWFYNGDGRFAARLLKLDGNTLKLVYTTLDDHENSYSGEWFYGDEDMETDVDEEIAKSLIANILPVMLEDDIYEIEED